MFKFLLCFLAPLTIGQPANGQMIGGGQSQSRSALDQVPYLDLSSKDRAQSNLAISKDESERSRKYDLDGHPPLFNKDHPEQSGELHFMVRNDYAAGFDPLHIKESTIIVIGTIQSITPHPTASGSFVYSTLAFAPESFLKGEPTKQPMLLERQGGVVLFPRGQKRYVGVINFGLPLPGHRYLLFLKRDSDAHSYVILGGYALNADHVSSLDREGRKFDSLSENDLLQKVKEDILSESH